MFRSRWTQEGKYSGRTTGQRSLLLVTGSRVCAALKVFVAGLLVWFKKKQNWTWSEWNRTTVRRRRSGSNMYLCMCVNRSSIFQHVFLHSVFVVQIVDLPSGFLSVDSSKLFSFHLSSDRWLVFICLPLRCYYKAPLHLPVSVYCRRGWFSWCLLKCLNKQTRCFTSTSSGFYPRR